MVIILSRRSRISSPTKRTTRQQSGWTTSSGAKEPKLRPILFEGQGIGRVFEQHRKNLHDKKKNRELADTPQIDEIIARQDATANLIKSAVEDLKKERARNFLDRIGDKSKLRDGDSEYVEGVVEFVNKVLYESILRTVAFQTAMVAGFFGEIERANDLLSLENKPPLDTNAAFEDFLAQMNAFFSPNSSANFRRLVECFFGRIEGEIKDWKIAAQPQPSVRWFIGEKCSPTSGRGTST